VGSSNSTNTDWRALRALTGRERVLLLAAALLLPCTSVALKTFGYKRVERLSRRVVPFPRQPTDDTEVATSTDRMVKVVSGRLPFPSACLARSLVLRTLLQAQGVESQLRIGVRREMGEVEAHAWVEHCGHPLSDPEDVGRRFSELALPPG
jgi:hypothetical protein